VLAELAALVEGQQLPAAARETYPL
jgi:hypothetical protein